MWCIIEPECKSIFIQGCFYTHEVLHDNGAQVAFILVIRFVKTGYHLAPKLILESSCIVAQFFYVWGGICYRNCLENATKNVSGKKPKILFLKSYFFIHSFLAWSIGEVSVSVSFGQPVQCCNEGLMGKKERKVSSPPFPLKKIFMNLAVYTFIAYSKIG